MDFLTLSCLAAAQSTVMSLYGSTTGAVSYLPTGAFTLSCQAPSLSSKYATSSQYTSPLNSRTTTTSLSTSSTGTVVTRSTTVTGTSGTGSVVDTIPRTGATVTGPLAWVSTTGPSSSQYSAQSTMVPAYTFYEGDGSTAAGWPSKDRWVNFDEMWSRQVGQIRTQCTSPNTEDETASLRDAILDVAARSAVDPRLILGVMMQESIGCVRVQTTSFCGTDQCRNPGVMQSHAGPGTCNINGVLTQPCPDGTIRRMIYDGTMGTEDYNLARLINENGRFPVAQAYWRAARQYNRGRGSIDGSATVNLSDGSFYVSNLANRMCGWVGFWPRT